MEIVSFMLEKVQKMELLRIMSDVVLNRILKTSGELPITMMAT